MGKLTHVNKALFKIGKPTEDKRSSRCKRKKEEEKEKEEEEEEE